MVLLIPVTYFLGVCVARARVESWRQSHLVSAVGLGVYLTLTTEALSIVRLLTPGAVAVSWSVAAAALAAVNWRIWSGRRLPSLTVPRGVEWWAIATGILLVVLSTGVTALISAPNNVDSMTYHMSRVAHWIQNQSVRHYATNFLPQLHQSPWSEFAIVHVQLLAGSDRYANLVQWISMIGSLLGVSFVARQLGGGPRVQLIAAAVAVSVPMGVLQAATTQNDYVLTFWIVCSVAAALELRRGAAGSQLLMSTVLGGSLGLAMLTKATTYLLFLPFAVWIGLEMIRSSWRGALRTALVAGLLAAAVNAGHFARNYALYGAVLGPGQEGRGYNGVEPDPHYKYTVDTWTPATFVANVVRNVAVHLGTPSYRINKTLERAVLRVHSVLGVPPDDPRSVFEDRPFFLAPLTLSEDYTGNLIHLVLIGVTMALIFVYGPLRAGGQRGAYAGALLVGFALLCLVLKWQPYNSRFHLPLFVLAAPIVAVVIDAVCRPRVSLLAVTALIVASLPWCFFAAGRELLGSHTVLRVARDDQYFSKSPDLLVPDTRAAGVVVALGCQHVGLSLNGDDFEYPLWRLLSRGRAAVPVIEHVHVRNLSARLPGSADPSAPCAIISTRGDASEAPLMRDEGYQLHSSFPGIAVYVRDEPAGTGPGHPSS